MLAKILAALAMPVLAALIVGGLLVATNHTKVPPLNPPPATSASPTPARSTAPAAAPEAMANACLGNVPQPFAGIAINNDVNTHVTDFQHLTGAHVKVVEVYNPFLNKFNVSEANQAIKLGALPLIQLNPRTVTMAQVASGAEDAYITRYADAVKNFRCYVVLSFGHEMNGWWYHWGMPWTTPSDFIAAWRHIHEIFANEGADNVIWSWDPSHQYAEVAPGKVASPASEWYPGNAYVDWIGIDGYLSQDAGGQAQNFKEIFAHQLASIRSVAKSKLIYVAETGVAPGPHDLQQIADLFAGLKQYDLFGVIWFDVNAKQPWRLEGRPAAVTAYHKAVASFPN